MLAGTVPDWIDVLEADSSRLRMIARVPLPSGVSDAPIDLTVRFDAGGTSVGETAPGSRLPARCPELHIVDGGDFCLGVEVDSLDDSAEAEAFWHRLADFLRNQRYAARHRRWPAWRWMSHGPKAAIAQIEAERIAAAEGWAEEYADGIENGLGWMGGELPRRHRGGGLVNARTPCPRACRRRDGAVLLRRNCPRREALEALILAEHARREGERSYIARLCADGATCCGRVDGCPLSS